MKRINRGSYERSRIDCAGWRAGWNEELLGDPNQRSEPLLQRLLPLNRIRGRGVHRLRRVTRHLAGEFFGNSGNQNLAFGKMTRSPITEEPKK